MFNTIDRRDTHAIKWERYRHLNLLPMWIADMDLPVCSNITQALKARIEHPIYGYTQVWDSLNQAVVNWCKQQYQWDIEPDWIVWMPGVVPSFHLAIELFSQHGRVIVQSQNYPPLLNASQQQGCTHRPISVIWNQNQYRWQLNWQQLEQEMKHPDCHLMILCNPMNPHGSVLMEQDLIRLGELCVENNIILCSDEIHCDIILDTQQTHVPASSIPSVSNQSITLMAASKTFNIAGLSCSFAIIPDASLQAKWKTNMENRIPPPTFLGMLATEIAFTQCNDWHVNLLSHLKKNRDLLTSALAPLNYIDYKPQPATFLAWLECTIDGINLSQHLAKAGLLVSPGESFGNQQAARLNFGTSREVIKIAIEKIQHYQQIHRL